MVVENNETAGGGTPKVDISRRRSPYSLWVKLRLVLWWAARALLFRTSFHTANGFRCWLLRRFGARIGRHVVMGPTILITHPWNLVIGDYSQIGDWAWLYAIDQIEIGTNAMVSQRSFLCTGSHDYTKRHLPLVTGPIRIGDGAWVCADCFVGPRVRIGGGAVVGARSSVFSDLPEMMICYGTPCKPVRQRVVDG